MTKLIYTDHAYERMYLRNIPKSLIQATVDHHDDLEHEDDGDSQFIKTLQSFGNKREVHVVAKPLPKDGKDTWLIKTVWVDGEEDPKLFLKLFRTLVMRLFHRKKAQG